MSTFFARSLLRERSSVLAHRSVVSNRRTLMTLKDVKYTAHAEARGQGRNGQVKSDDDCGLELRLAMPKSLGGKGDGQNPEQLLAMGYAACFLSALQMVSGQMGRKEAAMNAVIRTQVHIGQPKEMEGFGLRVDIQVEGIQDDELIQAAHKLCPYSRMMKNGAEILVTKT
ncbi:OsmC-like protein [Epithele typhae]|uniref:OsmC-like protein n=1 Tax=Epithele typhae TaxID=378194 RepID=UPI002007F309|nr:OsmC-like protein [Epithele typhae]KAH9941161.1 OsmC-like protein [Epithele typhae]